jgi:hypothetical protein
MRKFEIISLDEFAGDFSNPIFIQQGNVFSPFETSSPEKKEENKSFFLSHWRLSFGTSYIMPSRLRRLSSI